MAARLGLWEDRTMVRGGNGGVKRESRGVVRLWLGVMCW